MSIFLRNGMCAGLVMLASGMAFCGSAGAQDSLLLEGSAAGSDITAAAVPVFSVRTAVAETHLLPNSPSYSSSESTGTNSLGFGAGYGKAGSKVASRYDKYLAAGETAPKLTASDKFVLGLKDAISPLSAIGWVASAGYAQAVDGSPNYGQTGKGFAQRLGAGAARDFSEGVIGDSILAPIFHEDPRYYKLGRGHSFVHRVVYAGTRGLVTRTDGGHATLNLSNIGGNLAGSAMTNLYYPQLNRGLSQTMQTFGGSVGGSALGFVVSEFLSDTLEALHLKDSD